MIYSHHRRKYMEAYTENEWRQEGEGLSYLRIEKKTGF